MIALEIGFPAGRFHATPWDRAVNEGDVEWPPSPWRILRALVAGYANAGGAIGDAIAKVCDRLAGPPRYMLPPATEGHTRHYMPLGSLERTLVIDAFVAVERTALAHVVWDDVTLDADDRAALDLACTGVGYLGRAESWCTIRAVERLPDGTDRIAVDLAARAAADGPSSRRLGVAADCRGRGLMEALTLTTAAMRKERRTIPAGAAWLEYRFPPGFGFAPTEQKRVDWARSALPALTSLRFVVEGRNEAVRPPVAETLAAAETFRAAAMSRFSKLTGETAPPSLSGKQDERPLAGHGHAFILPRDLDGDGRIDHIDVWFNAGTDHRTFRAVRSVQKLYDWRLGPDETFALTYTGSARATTGRVWHSTTPFLLGAYPRSDGSPARREQYSPEAQLRRSLIEHGHPSPAAVHFWDHPAILRHERGGATVVAAFRSQRKGDRVIGKPFGVTVEFEAEISGPIAVGRYAHFGMGQFTPDG